MGTVDEDEKALMAGMGGLDAEDIEQLEAEMAQGWDTEGQVVPEASPPADDDDDDEESEEDDGKQDADKVEVEEHLREALEGSLRLKRLLSRDDEGKKKRRRGDHKLDPEKEGKLTNLLKKWGLTSDAVTKHVLEGCTLQELDTITKNNYAPDRSNMWKSAGEILSRYVAEMKERQMQSGQPLDTIKSFAFTHKLDFNSDKLLRALCHKDLRYLMENYDASKPIADQIKAAQEHVPEEDNTSERAIPRHPGNSTMGRFMRLELIDPVADAAVFGDANLTFAIKLAKHRQSLQHVGRVICTTFEELETLRERYPEIDGSIKVLEDMWAEVYHGVDCTRVALDQRFRGMEGKLGAVYYNFPHSGAIQGFFDGHPIVNWRHENLLRLFFRAMRTFVKPGGIIKVASNMGATGVRFSYIIGSGEENEFRHVETVPFTEWHLHRYGRSYGDKRDVYKRPDATNNQSYNAQAADRDMLYCFVYEPTGKTMPPQAIRLPPTLKTLRECADGPFRSLNPAQNETMARQLHKRFVMEVSGTHVG